MEYKDQDSLNSGATPSDILLPPSINDIHEAPAEGVNGTSLETPVNNASAPTREWADMLSGNFWKITTVLCLMVVILGSILWLQSKRNNEKVQDQGVSQRFNETQISLDEILAGKDLTLDSPSGVTINGPLQLGSDLSLTPSLQPTGAKRGQLYFDQGTNELAYYNGTNFVFLTGPTTANGGVQSLGGATGQVTLGTGLDSSAGQINNSGVLSVQGQSGNVTFTAGAGMVINGTTFSNGGVIGVTSGSSNVTVTNDGNGNISISVDSPIAGTGTVTSSGGNAGTIPLFTASQNIEDSIITQSGLNVAIAGSLSLTNALAVSSGGTGTSTLASNGILVGNGTTAITSVTAGSAGLCLLSTAGAPAWSACPSGGGGGVTSLNGLVGGLSIANSSATGSTITIDDATDTTKGIASFNSTNFSVAGGAVNTAQNIDATATPTFVGVNTNSITPGAALTVGVSAQTALLQGSTTTITSNGAGNNIVLNSAATIELQDDTNVTGSVATTGDLAVNGGDITSTGALNITPGGALTIGASSQALTLQGGATSSFRATSGANTTVVAFTSPTANTTLNFPALAAGTYTICTTSGNCAGAAATLQSVYGNSTNPEITLDATRGALTIRDNASALGANLLEVQDNAGSTTYLAVTASGISVTGTAVISGAISGTTITGSGNINTSGGALQTNGTSRIDNGGNLINIAAVTASGNATFQGGTATLGTNSQAGSIVLNDGSSNTGTLQVAALGQNTIYTLPDPGTGTATICLTTGNCAGSGSGVTTSGGTSNRLAKFNGSQTLTDSSITDNGTTVTTTGNLIVQGGIGTIGVAGVQGGTLRLAYGGGAFTGVVATDNLTADQNYLLPNASGTFCLTSGNCAGVGGTGDVLQGGNNFGAALTLGTNDAFAVNFETSGVTRMTIAANGSQLSLGSNMDLVLQGATAYITNSQGQTSSEALGQGATVGGANAVAVGNGATAAANAVSVGRNAGVSAGAFGGPVSVGDSANAGAWGVAVGQSSSTTGNNGTALGNGATAAQEAVALGMDTNAMLNGVALGYGAVTGGNSRIVIGHNATATADFQLVIGSDDTPVANAYIGNGVSSATPQATSLHATGGSGTDVAGADFNLAGGAGTGSAAGGNLNFQVATPGTSGSSANVPATVFSLNGSNGSALFKNLVNSASGFQVQNAGGAAIFTINTTTGNATLAGDLAVNGGDVTSTGALNITPGGVLTIGSTSQTLTLQGGASTSLSATSGANTTVIGFTSPTANTTLNFPALAAGTYTICTTSGNCSGAAPTLQLAYNNSSTPEIVLDATRLGLTIRDNGTPVGGNLLEVQNNAGSTTYFGVTASGTSITGTATATGNINSSSGTLQTNGTNRIDNTGNLVNIGNITGTGAITVASSGAGNDVIINGADQFIVQDAAQFNAQASFDVGTNGEVNIGGTGTGTNTRDYLIITSTNNTTSGTQRGMLIQNAAGTGSTEGLIALDNADTDTSVGYGIQITSSVAGITTALDVSDADIVTALAFGANDIDGTNFDVAGSTGNVTAGTYNGQTISSAANFTGSLGVSGNTTLTGDLAVNGGDITSTGALNVTTGGTISFQNGTSTNAFNVQNASNNRILTVDTTGSQVVLGQASALDGKLVFSNASNGNTATIVSGALTGNRTITLPDETGTVCIRNSANCGFLTGTSSSFIQNQNSAQQTSSNYWISGTGRADVALQTPSIDTATAAVLALGTTNATAINLNQNTVVQSGKTLTVAGGATSLVGATTGDALTVSNSTSTGYIAIFRDNATSVFTIADSGLVTAKSQGTSTTAFDIQNSSSQSLFAADTFNNTVHLRTIGRDNTSTFEAIWMQGTKNATTVFVGDNDNTSTYVANDFSGSVRFNGSNVGWGDMAYFPQGGGNGNNGQFRFSTSGSALNTTPNAKLGVGDLYVSGNAGIGTNSPSYKLHVAGDVNVSSGSVYRINGTTVCSGTTCTPASGSTSYIQNQSASQQSSSSFWTSGSGRVDGGVLTNNVTSNSGALTLQAATNVISLGGSDSLTANGGFNIFTGTNSSLTVNANGTGSLSLGNNATSGRVINIAATGTQATTSTTNIGTSTGAAQTVNIGSTNGTGTTTINAGSGGVNINGATSVSGQLSATSFTGAGLTDCDGTNSKLLYDSTTKQFSCGTDSASAFVRKASDELVTSSTTLQPDDNLTFTVIPGETYFFQMSVNATFAAPPSNGQFKYSITAPTGSTCNVSSHGVDSSGGGLEMNNVGCGTSANYGGGDGSYNTLITGTVVAGAGGGTTVALNWAQITSSATSTRVKAGSMLTVYKITGADLAEVYYSSDSSVSPGDVVQLDGSLQAGVKKTSQAYDSHAFGIVSTRPGHILGDDLMASAQGKPVLLALSGRVPVKVSTENGPIEPGDYLTSSSVPGVAMKATEPGYAIAQAMTSFSGEGIGSVLGFIKNGWYQPPAVSGQDLQNSTIGSGVIDSLNIEGPLTVTGDAFFQGKIAVKDIEISGHVTVGKDTAGTAIIPAGQTYVDVTFDRPYATMPKVTATATGFVAVEITNKTEDGFRINIPEAKAQDVAIDWISLQVKE